MAAYASLTPTQQAQIQSVANICRSFVVTIVKAVNASGVVSNAWNNGVQSLVAGLDSTEVIPNTTGYPDAQSLAPAQLETLVNLLLGFANPGNSVVGGSYYTPADQAIYYAAAGANAPISQ